MTDQPTRTGHQLDPTAVAGLQAHAERTRWDSDRYAAVLEDIATNGPPPVEDCTPREELREAQLARLAAQRPAVA
ncbi:hypothetical protein LEL86_19915 [Streptomyces sp. WA6-1-16]|uniref:hypothetical protein n=1 Tax=Streptomyces sp. WA6-1-16 TaxID=2879427 RepID=UPI000A241BAD|nr:hypothetical protein [Streptomyces sp. WA6-1-16]OSC75758.1 hypothetical protein B5180_05700 [Streptomyces sp. BF-3]UCA51411.1 hypothetical protein LEL86_19915 [Streptomyces sp. WA6-1-16]